MNAPSLLFLSVIYLVSSCLFAVNFRFSLEWAKKGAHAILYAGFLLSTFLIFNASVLQGHYLPVSGLYQALFFFGWSMLFVYLLMSWQVKLDTFGVVLVPLLFILTTASFLTYRPELKPIVYSQDRWFAVHVLAAFFAYASFALSFVGALLYLVQNHELKAKRASTFYHKLPPLEVLEAVVYRTIIFGFPLLTAALTSGFVWTRERYGEYWHWDPKFVLSMVTWFAYLVILYVHYVSSVRGRRVVIISIVAFCFVLVTFLVDTGIHNFMK